MTGVQTCALPIFLEQANQRPELELLKQALAGTDAAEISTGKAYQICWNMVGIAKLHKVTGNAQYLRAAQNIWASIREYHLTLGGGPWGGVGLRSREVFNHQSVFSPHGYVETCSILSWIQLNRELLLITGDAKYAEEIEIAAYNDLLGACAPNGEDWCYYSFPNGKRVYTTYWRCCKSSGAMALEELPAIAYCVSAQQELVVNLYGPGRASIPTIAAGTVQLEQITNYPFAGNIGILVRPEKTTTFTIKLRVPSWATGADIRVNGFTWDSPVNPGSYVVLEREWKKEDVIELWFPMRPKLHRRASSSVQESTGPDGAPIRQEVMCVDYLAITRGPLVYATALIDGFKMHETIRLSEQQGSDPVDVIDAPSADQAPSIQLNLSDRPPLVFHPYFEAGGREDGAWRLTWMELTTDSVGTLVNSAA